MAENGKQELERPDRLWFSIRGTPLKVNSCHGSTVFVHYSNAKQVNFNQRSAPRRRLMHQPEYLHPILSCFIKVITPPPRAGIQNKKFIHATLFLNHVFNVQTHLFISLKASIERNNQHYHNICFISTTFYFLFAVYLMHNTLGIKRAESEELSKNTDDATAADETMGKVSVV